MNERIAQWFLTTGKLGHIPFAPGTWGSLPTVVFSLLLIWIVEPRWVINLNIALFGLIFAIACVRFGRWAEQKHGRKDPSEVVADETAGQALPLLFLPWQLPLDGRTWLWNVTLALTAFVTFRIFDIAKPPPIRSCERLPVGWGVLVDDLIAGVYALAVTQGVAWLVLPRVFG